MKTPLCHLKTEPASKFCWCFAHYPLSWVEQPAVSNRTTRLGSFSSLFNWHSILNCFSKINPMQWTTHKTLDTPLAIKQRLKSFFKRRQFYFVLEVWTRHSMSCIAQLLYFYRDLINYMASPNSQRKQEQEAENSNDKFELITSCPITTVKTIHQKG